MMMDFLHRLFLGTSFCYPKRMDDAIRVLRKTRRRGSDACPIEIRARLFSPGGVILLASALVITALFFLSLATPGTTGAQQLIAFILFLATWAYVINGATERIHITSHAIIFRSALGRTLAISIAELEEMVLRHQGFTLDRGFETIEFRLRGKPPRLLTLGPCWQRGHLESFTCSVQQTLDLQG